jgi:hypothetical protein
MNPVVGGELQNTLNGNEKRLSWGDRIVRCRNRRRRKNPSNPDGENMMR